MSHGGYRRENPNDRSGKYNDRRDVDTRYHGDRMNYDRDNRRNDYDGPSKSYDGGYQKHNDRYDEYSDRGAPRHKQFNDRERYESNQNYGGRPNNSLNDYHGSSNETDPYIDKSRGYSKQDSFQKNPHDRDSRLNEHDSYGEYSRRNEPEKSFQRNDRPPRGHDRNNRFQNDDRRRHNDGNFDRRNDSFNNQSFNDGQKEYHDDVIYISNMPKTVTESDIAERFGSIGIIKTDKKTWKPKIWIYKTSDNESKGEATVTYDDPATASAAIEWFNGKEFMGQVINVQLSEKKSSDNKGFKNNNKFQPGLKKPLEMRQGDWKCPDCGNLNFSRRDTCNRCKRPRGDTAADNSSQGNDQINSYDNYQQSNKDFQRYDSKPY